MDEKQLLDAIRQIVREEIGDVEARLNQRIDKVEQAVLETSRDVKDIKSRLGETETDVRLLKKIVSN
ncbi:hypothetical protein [Alicyclobacillus dauci]|uniref:Uncharacterized protein n=1 Tax=Alicyclobacillus dauci TaxID=1475485 RepID=A0ABY6Z9W7_9BACL|nr:hypothetical protein [Alicyclobacillus dauci]WAH39478.1 hypothetical protein NZD86_24220 [Alicyclobacillus dauci]WAH39538.1 hypothetical protein NZD86_23920 [Alicyclobacillus dauci]